MSQSQSPKKEEKASNTLDSVNFGDTDFTNAHIGPIRGTGIVRPISLEDRQSLRKWWHGVLREYDHYSCYALFLVLPSNRGAINYLTKFGRELDLISGKNCLVVALSDTDFRCSGFNKEAWCAAIEEHATEGHSIKAAQLFNISYDTFPCLVIFEDIRSAKHVVINLRIMTDEEIAEKMRTVFSIIQKATKEEKNPIEALESHNNSEKFTRAGRSIVSQISIFTGKTFETAMEAWIKSIIK